MGVTGHLNKRMRKPIDEESSKRILQKRNEINNNRNEIVKQLPRARQVIEN